MWSVCCKNASFKTCKVSKRTQTQVLWYITKLLQLEISPQNILHGHCHWKFLLEILGHWSWGAQTDSHPHFNTVRSAYPWSMGPSMKVGHGKIRTFLSQVGFVRINRVDVTKVVNWEWRNEAFHKGAWPGLRQTVNPNYSKTLTDWLTDWQTGISDRVPLSSEGHKSLSPTILHCGHITILKAPVSCMLEKIDD